MTVYYNDNDARQCRTLRYRIATGDLPEGDVDERGIEQVRPDDVAGYGQVHWFAGQGGWPLALRLAAWPEDYPVWTGSCPCQPFSSAGRRLGFDDPRDLWPVWYRLIAQCRPLVCFGEQVTGKAVWPWVDRLCLQMEDIGYAVAPLVLPASSVGADHRRHRFYWVAAREACGMANGYSTGLIQRAETIRAAESGRRGQACGVGDGAHALGRAGERGAQEGTQADGVGWGRPSGDGVAGGMDNRACRGEQEGVEALRAGRQAIELPGWSDFDLIWCGDGAYRRIEPGLSPLADGVPDRVGQIAGYGNAIVPPLAAQFVRAFMETLA